MTQVLRRAYIYTIFEGPGCCSKQAYTHSMAPRVIKLVHLWHKNGKLHLGHMPKHAHTISLDPGKPLELFFLYSTSFNILYLSMIFGNLI
jgi:hypothetical protein